MISKFDTSVKNSVAVDRVVIDDFVYAVNSTNALSSVTKNQETKTVNLNITNETSDTFLLRYFTFREEK